MDPTQAALRPLTLPSLSPELSKLQQLRLALDHAHDQIHGYDKVRTKLATLTDEPTWNAYVSSASSFLLPVELTLPPILAQIPFGPLAYFPGQLVHTNDITRVTPRAEGPAQGNPERVLRSAKQASEDATQAINGPSTPLLHTAASPINTQAEHRTLTLSSTRAPARPQTSRPQSPPSRATSRQPRPTCATSATKTARRARESRRAVGRQTWATRTGLSMPRARCVGFPSFPQTAHSPVLPRPVSRAVTSPVTGHQRGRPPHV